jgi:hypothetical protein
MTVTVVQYSHNKERREEAMKSKIVVATKAAEVFDALEDKADYVMGLYTHQVYQALTKDTQLVIIDFDDLVLHPDTSVEMLRSVLAESGAIVVNSEDFLAQPDRWLKDAEGKGGRDPLEKLCIAFTSYSGGTGKTTLALDTALHFAHCTKLPVMLMEFTYGLSALDILTGQEMPHLFELTTQLDIEPRRWKGVTLVPMDYENCQDLTMGFINNYVKKQRADHVLTVIDSQWPHGLIGAVKDEVDQWLVVAAPRLGAVENAERLRGELNPHASVVINQNGGPLDSLALAGRERALTLPRVRHPDRFDGELGKKVLEWLYGKTWKQYEKSFWDQLRERF